MAALEVSDFRTFFECRVLKSDSLHWEHMSSAGRHFACHLFVLITGNFSILRSSSLAFELGVVVAIISVLIMAIPRQKIPMSTGVVAKSSPKDSEKMCKASLDTAAANYKKLDTPPTPWWRRGGMHANEVGMGITVLTPPFVLYMSMTFPEIQTAFLILLIGGILSSVTIHGMRGTFCVVAVPVYMASLVFSLGFNKNPLLLLGISLVLAIIKVGICMSVCLHRYAAHAAFKCNPTTRFLLMILGCSANQGGPIWWASQHRCHHKYCDVPKDPHSQSISGVEDAFSFFQIYNQVNEEFAPVHIDTMAIRILDTFSFIVLWMELIGAWSLGGPTALFVQYTASWLCQTMTLWFNLANHPISNEHANNTTCLAKDDKGPLQVYYPAFILLNTLYPIFGLFVAERNHQHHHDHSTLAKRSDIDGAYFSFILPLKQVGLVWDVKMPKSA